MPTITIQASDGSGSFNAHVCLPPSGKGPGLVISQEIFGINGFIRQLCEHYASLGYVAVAPDLFWRIEPGLDLNPDVKEDHDRAFQLFGQFNVEKGVEDLIATMNALRGHAAVTGKVGCVGYCLGGKMAYLMATRSDVDASVGYYGVGLQDMLGEASAITKPLLLHIAEQDKFTPPEAQEQIRAVLSNTPMATLQFYAGQDHAFARIGGDHYNAEAATLANKRTEEFFAVSLSP